MTSAPPPTSDAALVPAARLSWAVLDLHSNAPTHSGRPDAQLAASCFAELLPSDPAASFSLFIPLPNAKLAACAAPRTLLEHPPARFSLTPDSLPPLPELQSLSPSDQHSLLALMNFLVGEFEPQSLRAHRTARSWIAAAAILAACALIALGLLRRSSVALTHAAATLAARDQLVATLAPSEASLHDELASLRITRPLEADTTRFDAARTLSDFLAQWPADIGEPHTQNLSVTRTGIVLSLTLRGAEPRDVLSRFKAPAGWHLDEPRLAATSQGTELTLRLTPLAPSGALR